MRLTPRIQSPSTIRTLEHVFARTVNSKIRTLTVLLLLTIASLTSADDELPTAADILARAKAAMGGVAIDRIEGLSIKADCTGPRGAFVTEVHSGGDGQVVFHQEVGDRWATRVVAGDVAWAKGSGGEIQLLGDDMKSMARGHEFHMQVLAPEQRYSDPRTAGVGEFAGGSAVEVAFTNQGRPLSIFYRLDDHLPAGMVFEPAGDDPETITIVYDDWQTIQGVKYFGSFELTHGENAFTYDYTRIEPGAVDPARFEMPPEVEALIQSKDTSEDG